MPQELDSTILKEFPHACYQPALRLVTWHPQGPLDDALADNIIDFIESEERIVDAPFDRYADLNGLTEVSLKFGHASGSPNADAPTTKANMSRPPSFAPGRLGLVSHACTKR